MKKMLKRADGSYSQRGLWDNIRANKGSGKEPTKEMLKQEKKIKSKKQTGGSKTGDPIFPAGDSRFMNAPSKPKKVTTTPATALPKESRKERKEREEKEAMKYRVQYAPSRFKQTGGKKSNWMEESKELKFGGPSKKKYQTAGPMDTKTAVGQVFQGKMTAAQGQAAIGKTPKPAMTPEQKTEFMSKLKTYGKKTGGKRRMGGKNC